MAMNGNEGGSAYPPNPDVKSGSCLIAGFQPLTVFHPSYWNAYKAESGATFSIDMVRLKLSFINGKGEWLSTHAQTFDCDSMSAWTSKIRPGGWYELWSFTIVFDEDKAKKNGYEVDTLYDYVGKNVEGLGNERIARGTWRAAKGYDEVDAQTLAISKLSRQKWVMQNIKSLAFREDDDEIYDGIETIRRVYPERVFDSESGE